MANQIAIDVYEFGMGLEFQQKYTQPFIRENIVSYDQAVIYNHAGTQFADVRSKITANQAGVVKDYYVAQTVAQIKTLLDA
jgi:hypothetical protein